MKTPQLIKHILNNGIESLDRTGIGTIAVFGAMTSYDLTEGFAVPTQKKLAWKPVVGELLWFMKGSTNIEDLRDITWGANSNKKTIWDENYEAQGKALGYSNGYLGPVYGKQWRDFGGHDQLYEVIESIKNNPNSRRHLVSAWNPTETNSMALPPCHYSFIFNVEGKYLDIMYSMRSNDIFLGKPFNDASYALLLSIVAKMTGYIPRNVIASIANAHIYLNHINQSKEMISRAEFELPSLEFPDFKNTDTFKQIEEAINWGVDSYKLVNYKSHDSIKAPMAV